MKKSLERWGCCALLAASALSARADNAVPSSAAKPGGATITPPAGAAALQPSPSGVSTRPRLFDGVEFSTIDPAEVAARTLEIKAEQKDTRSPSYQVAQEQAIAAKADTRDWMLRDYEARLQQRGLASASDLNPASLSQSPDSSGTTPVDPLLAALHPNQPAPAPSKSDSSKPDLSKDLSPIKLQALTSLQPLLPTVNVPAPQTPRTAWNRTPAAAYYSLPVTDRTPPPGFTSESNRPSSSLDIPGLTAAENGMGPSSALNFPQDPLPDESVASPRQKRLSDRNNFLVPTAPTSDVSEFFKKQAEALQPPSVPTTLQPAVVPAKPTAPRSLEPTAKPAISGLRSHVDDPFDILNR